MMPPSVSTSVGSSWLKLALIPVLAAILAGVLVWPSPKSESDPTVNAANPARQSRRSLKSIRPSEMRLVNAWDEVEQDLAKQFNPFLPLASPAPLQAVPAGMESPAASQANGKPSPSSTSDAKTKTVLVKVQAVHKGEETFSALIEGKPVQVGDSLPDGRRIVAITMAGIVVESE